LPRDSRLALESLIFFLLHKPPINITTIMPSNHQQRLPFMPLGSINRASSPAESSVLSTLYSEQFKGIEDPIVRPQSAPPARRLRPKSKTHYCLTTRSPTPHPLFTCSLHLLTCALLLLGPLFDINYCIHGPVYQPAFLKLKMRNKVRPIHTLECSLWQSA
jgi:hypothetical protein